MTEHVCPDASVLAAFAEGVLPPEQRAEVERHVADCPECPTVVGEVTRFLSQSDDAEEVTPPRHYRWWFIAAAVAAICIPVAIWRTTLDPFRGVRRIAAASPERTYEGRLHGFPHAPFSSPRSAKARAVPPSLQAEAAKLARRGQDAEVLHARGVVALLSGNPQEAASLLSDATDSAPLDAAIWNDLAVAELARANRGERTAITSALKAANRAAELSPSSPDAHYNRALALERIGDDTAAARAFRQALEHETTAAWQNEIGEHLQRLENGR